MPLAVPHPIGNRPAALHSDRTMDWDNVRGEKPRQPPAVPVLALLETCWRLAGPSGRVISCGIYRTEAPGVEVRAGFSEGSSAPTRGES
jgi:hypothetical protein